MLRRIQERLHDLYDLQLRESVDDFVCDADVASAADGRAVERGEVLVVVEQPHDVRVGLYVDPAAVAMLHDRHAWWRGRRSFRAFCLATEGVSHFVYLMFRAASGHSVSQLELEIQGEVDKYATGLLHGPGGGAALSKSRMLRGRLFDHVRFHDPAASEAGARYRLALRVAADYARSLESRYVARGDMAGLARDLRRFYRKGAHGKLQRAA
jgi:hypothetical protein